MFDWIVKILSEPSLQGLAAIVAILQVVPKRGIFGRLKHPVFTHVSFLFIGLIVGIAIASRNDVYGTYEWQWSGENWYGRVTLDELNNERVISQAKMGLLQKTLEDTISMNGKVFDLAPNTVGTFKVNNDGSITMDLTIEKKSRRTGFVGIETINGTLYETLCYAGNVSYSGNEGLYSGDVVLVKYLPSFGVQVNDWFSSEQDWFDKYFLDR